jgi:hypothetical protein
VKHNENPPGEIVLRGIFLRRVNPEKALTAEDAEENKIGY